MITGCWGDLRELKVLGFGVEGEEVEEVRLELESLAGLYLRSNLPLLVKLLVWK